jgi:hypothetical protein
VKFCRVCAALHLGQRSWNAARRDRPLPTTGAITPLHPHGTRAGIGTGLAAGAVQLPPLLAFTATLASGLPARETVPDTW